MPNIPGRQSPFYPKIFAKLFPSCRCTVASTSTWLL